MMQNQSAPTLVIVLCIGLVMAFSFTSFGQDQPKKDPSSTKIEIIQKNDYFSDGKKAKKSKGPYNVIKIDPLYIPIFEGEASLFYERSISDAVSIEVGLGLTYSYNFYRLLHLFDFSDLALIDNSDKISSTGSQTGFALRAQIRYYFDMDDALEGWYGALGTVYKTYPLTYNGTYSDFTGSSFGSYPYNYTATNSYNDYLLIVGRQVGFGSGDFFYDGSIGIGVSLKSVSSLNVARDYNGNVQGFAVSQTSSMGIGYMISMKIGYAF